MIAPTSSQTTHDPAFTLYNAVQRRNGHDDPNQRRFCRTCSEEVYSLA